MSRLIDLSHTIYDGLVTYPGLPAPVITDYMTREESKARYEHGTTFHIARIEMIANTGTYVDTPNHRYAEGDDLSTFPLERIANVDGVVVDATQSERAIPASLFENVELEGRAVLIHTGWSRHFGMPAYGIGHPYVSEAAAERIVSGGAVLLGIDSLNVDDLENRSRPIHSRLLRADIAIVEHLTGLDRLPRAGFRFFAAAPKFRGVSSFPVRAFALVE